MTDKDSILNVLKTASLTEKTIQNYKERMHHLENMFDAPILDIILGGKASIDRICAAYDKDTSKKSYITIILSIFRHIPKLKEEHYKLYQVWAEAFTKIDKAVEERYKQNAPTQKQEDGYVAFKDITAMRDTLQKGSIERLLLSMYTYIPPLRADFNSVRLYKTVPSNPSKNYIHMTKNGCKLVLNEYKTFATHGTFEKQLPAELCEEIHASLDNKPREYLFTKRAGGPYDNPNAYMLFANGIFKRLFKKPLTISLIRHSFISTLDFNTLTIAEKEVIAKDMLHTTRLQDQYRLIFK